MIIEAAAVSAATALLATLFKEGATEFAKKAGEKAFAAASKLAEGLRSRFQAKNDIAASALLDTFEKSPDQLEPAFRGVLDKLAAKDAELMSLLEVAVADAGPQVWVRQRAESAQTMTGIEGAVHRGTAVVDQEAKTVGSMTGIEGPIG